MCFGRHRQQPFGPWCPGVHTYYVLKVTRCKLVPWIGYLEKRLINGWSKRQVTLVVDVLINPRKSHGHRTWCRGARPVLPWACLPGRRLGPLHRVLPRIWPYLAKNQKWSDRQNYSERLITLSHDEILTNMFASINCGTLQMRIAVSRE